MTTWVEYPTNRDLAVQAGFLYAALVRLQKRWTKAQVVAAIQAKGFRLDDYQERGDAGGNYRTIAVMGLALKSGAVIPGGTPFSPFDDSGVTKLWAAKATGGVERLPPGAQASTGNSGLITVGVLAALGGTGYLVWRHYARRR